MVREEEKREWQEEEECVVGESVDAAVDVAEAPRVRGDLRTQSKGHA